MHIKVSVRTDSKREFVKIEKDSYLVAVSMPAERGLANDRVLELLRIHLGPTKRVIKIESGHHSPHKVILVEDSVV
jgi:uncharacterized protein YggU (UPF0235/DUF167 family)